MPEPSKYVSYEVDLSDSDVTALVMSGFCTMDVDGEGHQTLTLTDKGSRWINRWINDEVKAETGLSLDEMEAIIDA